MLHIVSKLVMYQGMTSSREFPSVVFHQNHINIKGPLNLVFLLKLVHLPYTIEQVDKFTIYYWASWYIYTTILSTCHRESSQPFYTI